MFRGFNIDTLLGRTSPSLKNMEIEMHKKNEESEKVEKAEEWIWVKGYKGTDKDMRCRDYQYKLMECFDISDDKPVVECEHGFHMCRDFGHVLNYYSIGNGNRFFEVKALVRKKDYEMYGIGWGLTMTPDGNLVPAPEHDKLVAKSIIFTRELTADEILKGFIKGDWTDEDKKRALEIGIAAAEREAQTKRLLEVGYSETFAAVIIKAGKGDIAYSVGTQEGLSMDMKVWTIFNS